MENKPLQEQAEQTQIQDANEQNDAFLQESNTMDRQDRQQSIEKQENIACKNTMTEEINGQNTPLLATAVTEMNAFCHQKIDSRLVNLLIKLTIILSSIFFFFSITSIFVPPKQFNLSYFLSGMVLIGLVLFYRHLKRERLKYFQRGIIERYEFYKDYFLQRTLKNGVFVGEMRYSYQDVANKKFVAIKGDAGYLILDIYSKYITRFYVHLKGVSVAEREQLQQLFAISLTK